MKRPNLLSALALMCLPWFIKRALLVRVYGNVIHREAYIGLSLLLVEHIEMSTGARIGHLTVVKGLRQLRVAESGRVGNLNWITGLSIDRAGRNFAHVTSRDPSLNVGPHAAITHRHIVDCTDSVTVGAFSTLAGFRSQILTHSIDVHANRQDCQPVKIGEYAFVATACILLPGSVVPSHSLICAGSVVSKQLTSEWSMYGGVPARTIKSISEESLYFTRTTGRVD